MVDYAFSVGDLEYFLLIFTRVSGFVFIAPFFSMGNTPARVRIAFSFFTALLLYETLMPAPAVVYDTVMGYALIVMKEAVTGLLLGLGASMCTAIVNFAGSVVDMETGLSMATLWDPATRENTSISGAFYQAVKLLLQPVPASFRLPFLYGNRKLRTAASQKPPEPLSRYPFAVKDYRPGSQLSSGLCQSLLFIFSDIFFYHHKALTIPTDCSSTCVSISL